MQDKSIYAQSNDLCNALDSEIRLLGKNTKIECCEFKENGIDIFTRMYYINEAFKKVAEARSLLMKLK